MKNGKRWMAAVLCAVLLTGCRASSQPAGSAEGSAQTEQPETVTRIPADELTFGGCESLSLIGNLAAAAATGSTVEQAGAATSFYGTSGEAWQRLLDGELDVALAYAPDSETQAALEAQGIAVQAVGRDALVFLAGGAQQDVTLTKAELAAAYQDGAGTWTGYAAAPGSDSRALFADIFGEDRAGVQLGTGEDALTAACPHTEQTLCYTTYLEMQENGVPQGTAVVAVDGVLPTAQTLTEAEGGYPLCASYYIAVRAGLDEREPAMLFYRWVTSERGRQWLAEAADSAKHDAHADDTQSADQTGSGEG